METNLGKLLETLLSKVGGFSDSAAAARVHAMVQAVDEDVRGILEKVGLESTKVTEPQLQEDERSGQISTALPPQAAPIDYDRLAQAIHATAPAPTTTPEPDVAPPPAPPADQGESVPQHAAASESSVPQP